MRCRPHSLRAWGIVSETCGTCQQSAPLLWDGQCAACANVNVWDELIAERARADRHDGEIRAEVYHQLFSSGDSTRAIHRVCDALGINWNRLSIRTAGDRAVAAIEELLV